MKTHRTAFVPLALVAGLLAGCPSAKDADSGAPPTAPGGANGGPTGTGSTSTEPAFHWARALDIASDAYKIATTVASNGDVILVGATSEAKPIALDGLTLAPSTKLVLFAARFGSDGAPRELRELAHMTEGQYRLEIDDLVADPEGGFFVAGNFDGDMVLTDGTPVNDGGRSYAIHSKADGTVRSYDIGFGDMRPAIAADRAGNLAVSTGYRSLPGKDPVDGLLALRIFLPDGSVRWERDINGTFYPEEAFFPKVRFGPDGSVFWAAGLEGIDFEFTGKTAESQFVPRNTDLPMFFAKYSPDGVPFFEDGYDPAFTSESTTVWDIEVDDEGASYLFYQLDDGNVDFKDPKWSTDLHYYSGVAKFDGQGVLQWVLPLTKGSFNSMAVLPNGRLVLGGASSVPVVALDASGREIAFEAGDGGRRTDGIFLFVDATTGRPTGVQSYGDAFDQSFLPLSVNNGGAFSVVGSLSGSMELGGLTVGDASKPGARAFLASGAM